MKFTYYLGAQEDENTPRILHNATCESFQKNKEKMLPLGRHEQFRVALDVARGVDKKAIPCPRCVLRRRLYNIAPSRRFPVPVRHSE